MIAQLLITGACTAVALTTATLGILAAREPRLAHVRWLIPIALMSALYSINNIAFLLPHPSVWVAQAGRANLALGLLQTAAWLPLSRLLTQSPRRQLERGLVLLLAVCAVLSLVPGVFETGELISRTTPFGSTMHLPAPTLFVGLPLALGFIALSWALIRLYQRRAELPERSIAPLVGLATFMASSILEALSLGARVALPYASELGSMAMLLGVGWGVMRGVGVEYSKMQADSERLEHDVDERTRQLLEVRTALTRADRLAALGQLAASVGHEINNPLTFVMANLREVTERLPSADDAGERAHLGELASEALDGTERIRRVVGDLRLLSRERDAVPFAGVDVHRVLGSALKLVEHVLKHRALVSELYGDLPHVKVDPQRLAQVFVNLLVNAAQAIPEDRPTRGTITVRTSVADDGRVVIEISDDGLGIAPHHIPRLFEPYFTTKPSGEGTGLGLFVSHGIVRSFDGELLVESHLGLGTTMRVILPVSPGEPAELTSSSPILTVARRRARILVVDDEPIVARALKRMLRNHDVTIALDGEHALTALRASAEFDVIVCDLMMPGLSGVDLMAKVCELWPELEQRFLFVTGGAVTPRSRELLDRPTVRSLQKPIDPEILSLTVDDIVAELDRTMAHSSMPPGRA